MTTLASSMATISYEQFQRIALTMGKAHQVIPNPSAKIPAYKIILDFGEQLNAEHKTSHQKEHYVSSAQLCANHTDDDISDKNMLCVINFPRKQIGKMTSDCLVTGVQDPNPELPAEDKRSTTVFMTSSQDVPKGSRITIDGTKEVVASNDRSLAWPDFTIADLRVGTVLHTHVETLPDKVHRLMMKVDLGKGQPTSCVALVNSTFDPKSLIDKQAMMLTNLDLESQHTLFNTGDKHHAVLCTISGETFVTPAKPVAAGFKLA